jgi:hypothetical protein
MKNPALFERRLKLLRTEVDLDFSGLVESLENGLKVVVMTELNPNLDLDPDALRRLGGMVMLCRHYGAAVIFADETNFIELNSRNSDKS